MITHDTLRSPTQDHHFPQTPDLRNGRAQAQITEYPHGDLACAFTGAQRC